jgi:hypothetical protein
MNSMNEPTVISEKVLDKVFPGVGKYAFQRSVGWRERAKRVLALIKFLRGMGDVYLVSRQMEKDDLFFFLAQEKGCRRMPAPSTSQMSSCVENLAKSRVTVLLRLDEADPIRRLFEFEVEAGPDGKAPAVLVGPNREIFYKVSYSVQADALVYERPPVAILLPSEL